MDQLIQVRLLGVTLNPGRRGRRRVDDFRLCREAGLQAVWTGDTVILCAHGGDHTVSSGRLDVSTECVLAVGFTDGRVMLWRSSRPARGVSLASAATACLHRPEYSLYFDRRYGPQVKRLARDAILSMAQVVKPHLVVTVSPKLLCFLDAPAGILADWLRDQGYPIDAGPEADSWDVVRQAPMHVIT